MKKIWKVTNAASKIPDLLCSEFNVIPQMIRAFFLTAVLRQRAEEVANLEKELRELQITAGRLVEKRNQNQNHFEQTEGRLQKQQEGKYQLVSCVGLY